MNGCDFNNLLAGDGAIVKNAHVNCLFQMKPFISKDLFSAFRLLNVNISFCYFQPSNVTFHNSIENLE